MLDAKLIVVGGDAKRTEVALKKLPATIGRAKDASITLPHSLVSRKHCELFEENNQLFVRDLNSLNGTYLNNERVDEVKSILPGQLLTLGNVTFRADYEVVNATDQAVDDHPVALQPPMKSATQSEEPDTDHGLNHPPGVVTSDFVFVGESKQVDISDSMPPLDALPSAAPQASFSGQIETSEPETVQVDPKSIQIDIGNDAASVVDPSQSSLNEFFRKMPR